MDGSGFYQTAQAIEEKGASLVVLTTTGLDTRTPMGRAMFGMLAVFAEFELAIAKERTMAGLAAARKAGRIGGRKSRYTLAELEAASGLGTRPGARKLGMTVAGFIRALDRERARAAARQVEDLEEKLFEAQSEASGLRSMLEDNDG